MRDDLSFQKRPERRPYGGFAPPGDGHPGTAAHPELPGGELGGGGKVDHIGAVGLQKTGIGQQGLCHLGKGDPQGERGHVLAAGKVVVHHMVGAFQILDVRKGQGPQAHGRGDRDDRAVFRLGGPVQQGCQLLRTERSSGIAVGMATNIPPHNLTEVINGCLAYIDDEDISIEGLMEHIPGPDFPTAAIINGRRGIEEAYRTGRGKVYIRARAEVEVDAKTGRETIIVHEIPYQVNKARLIEKIAELVKEKRVEGISALRDESDKDGMRIVIEVKRDAVGEVVLNNLYSQTQLQVSFGINMVALHHGQPKIMNLKDIIAAFVRHRREVVTRRTIFELRKARDRAHILEALAVALANIDPIIELIRLATTPASLHSIPTLLAYTVRHVHRLPM